MAKKDLDAKTWIAASKAAFMEGDSALARELAHEALEASEFGSKDYEIAAAMIDSLQDW